VDDDPGVRAALRAVFGLETDWLVRLESDPRAAIETVSKTEVDVVISDFLMPHMDGVTFLENVRRLRPAAGLILLTGCADRRRVDRAVVDLGIEYMEKPWSNEALVSSVRSALAGRDPGLARPVNESVASGQGLS
jgi:DNA-binding NtrC family response regulator